MTKGQNRWALQSNQWNQVWKGSNGVSGTLNEFREEGVKYFTPQSNIHFFVGFLKEVLNEIQVIKYQNIQVYAPKVVQVLFQDRLR